MATFLLCMKPITQEELDKNEVIFNLLLIMYRLNIPKTINIWKQLDIYFKEISNYEHLLVNIQAYNSYSLGIEITNIEKRDYHFVIFIGSEGIELGYANNRYERVQKLDIEDKDYDSFIFNKIKEIDKM